MGHGVFVPGTKREGAFALSLVLALSGCSALHSHTVQFGNILDADEAPGAGQQTTSNPPAGTAPTGPSSGTNTGTGTGIGTGSGTGTGNGPAGNGTPPTAPSVTLPRTGIGPSELAVLVNDNDPQSVAVATYYQLQRGIPVANMIHVSIAPLVTDISSADFTAMKTAVDAQLPATIQAYAVTWTYPFRVDSCMSITSALTYGYIADFCNGTWLLDSSNCKNPVLEQNQNPLYTAATTSPFTDLALRPAMMIAGESAAAAEAVIDRGVAADGTFPKGSAYLYRTSDVNRSARWGEFSRLAGGTDYASELFGNPADVYHAPVWDPTSGVAVQYLDNSAGTGSDYLMNAQNVLFYLTGAMLNEDLNTNTYLPGALGDQMTSFEGVLNGELGPSFDSTVFGWIAATASTGVTASYGTVIEPCMYFQKFPDAIPLMEDYYEGATAVEAYAKSVAAPYEGLIVGEPLARPFGNQPVTFANGTLTIQTTALPPGASYVLQAADAANGPWTTVQTVSAPAANNLVTVTQPQATQAFYQLIPTPAANTGTGTASGTNAGTDTSTSTGSGS